jgi:hypothetical protein
MKIFRLGPVPKPGSLGDGGNLEREGTSVAGGRS